MVTLVLLALALTPAQILDSVRQAYASLSAVHIKAVRTDTVAAGPEAGSVQTQYELAEKPGKYRAYLRRGDLEALAVNDGSTLWKSLPRLKQWSQEVFLARPATPDDGNIGDLHARLRGILLGSFVFLSQSPAELVRETRDSYVMRIVTPGARHELSIDKRSFLVNEWNRWESKGIAVGESADARTTIRITSLVLNGAVPDSAFTFVPDGKWQQRPSLAMPGDEKSALVGRAAPEFTLKTLDAETVRLKDLRGTVVFLDFWATWCPPCRAEMPSFERLQKEFAGTVRFVLPTDEDPSVVKRYLAEHPTSMTVLIDPGTAVQRRYGVYSLPVSFVIGADGTIRQQFVGVRTESALRRTLQAALAAR